MKSIGGVDIQNRTKFQMWGLRQPLSPDTVGLGVGAGWGVGMWERGVAPG